MANKPDKFGIKFWMVVDIETKYLFNGSPNVGKDESRSGAVSVPTDVGVKLMMLLFKKGHDTIRSNRREIQTICKIFAAYMTPP